MAPGVSPVRWGQTLGYGWAVRASHSQQVSGWLTLNETERREGPVLWQFQKVKKTILQVRLNFFLLFTSQQHAFKLMWRPLRVAPFWGLDSDSVPSVTYSSVLGRNHFGFWSESFWVNCHHSSKWQYGSQSWSKKISQNPAHGRASWPFPPQSSSAWLHLSPLLLHWLNHSCSLFLVVFSACQVCCYKPMLSL